MPTNTSHTERIRALLSENGHVDQRSLLPPSMNPIAHLVHAFLTWEASGDAATEAMGRLMTFVSDFNDLRVCEELEVSAILGDAYPDALDRCYRLRACLNSLFARENGLTFSTTVDMDRRQLRTYLNTLDGIVPFVIARVQLFVFSLPIMPMDERLLHRLLEHRMVPADLTLRKTQRFVEKVCGSTDAVRSAYLAIESLPPE